MSKLVELPDQSKIESLTDIRLDIIKEKKSKLSHLKTTNLKPDKLIIIKNVILYIEIVTLTVFQS